VLFTIPIFVSYTALEKAGGLEVPVVWWHLMPFATTTQHAPPVGFGDGHTYFSFAAKLKWGIAYKTVYELVYKDAVRVHAYTRIIGMQEATVRFEWVTTSLVSNLAQHMH